jgi:uncharacterized repeat protein (TIGR03803 family)
VRKFFILIFTLGVAFRICAQTNIIFTRLFSFDGTNGARPLAQLTIGKDGNIYGTTDAGGVNDLGTIFKLTPSGRLTTLFSFDGYDGCRPAGELIQGPNDELYGVTIHGGKGYDELHKFGNGTIFKIKIDGTCFTNLYFFSGGNDSGCGLALGPDGYFYGMTQWGGKTGLGMIYRISPNGDFKTIISFDGNTAMGPENSLVLGKDDNFYGTLAFGGKFQTGVFFRLTTNGVFAILASFNETNNIGVCRNKLAQGADGDFYGTTEFGGAYNNRPFDNQHVGDGTFFKVSTNGTVTELASFNGWNGAHPRGQLVRASDGNFYGVTLHDMPAVIAQPKFNMRPTIPDADYTGGTIFRATTNGNITKLFSFTGRFYEYAMTNGYGPNGLAADSNGYFYGTTVLGGEKAHMAGYASGTVFKFRLEPASQSK